MEDILALREEKSHLIRSAEDVLNKAEKEGRVLSEDEKTQSTSLLADAKKLDLRISDIEDHERRAKQIRDESEALRKVNGRRAPQEQPNNDLKPQVKNEHPAFARYGSLKAFKGNDADFNAFATGMWLINQLFPQNHPLKWKSGKWVDEHRGQLWNTMTTSVPSAGGNLTPDAMSSAIIDLREQYGILRQWADVVPMPGGGITIPRRTGSVTPYWKGEAADLTASDASWDNVVLTSKKLTALTKVSTELSEDAIVNVADWITNDIGQQFAYEEDRVGFNGTGLDTDGGVWGLLKKIQDSAYSASWPVVPTATHNTFSELDAADIGVLMATVPQYALNGSAFFTSQAGASLVFGRLMAAGGGNSQQTLSMENISAARAKGIVGFYQGYPIVASQVFPNNSTTMTNLPMLAFGNMSKAIILGETRQMNFATDMSVYFASDCLAIRATARLDINVHTLGNTTTAGPLCVLKGGSS